jgi:hypothetical protein
MWHRVDPRADFSALEMEAICSSETSVHTTSTRRHIPEDGILHSHRRENLKSYKRYRRFTEECGHFKESQRNNNFMNFARYDLFSRAGNM